ncbi:MAG: hypothetical protein M3P18_23830 [Actinomycetota bacterium]|nr:hypothetical protein [Actinomycetota bacterium]
MSLTIDEIPSTDATPLEWWARTLVSGNRVRGWLPDVFEQYARILHPAYLRTETPQGIGHELATWSDVARWSGKVLTTQACIDDLLVRGDGALWSERGSRPREGQLDPLYLRRLVELLAPTLGVTRDVWFLVWSGYGDGKVYTRQYKRVAETSEQREHDDMELNPSWRGSGRRYLLFSGSIGAPRESAESNLLAEPLRSVPRPPNFWWPTDREWFVSTDIDFFSTYVGGSASLIGTVLEDDVLETMPVDLDDPADPCPSSSTI